MKDGLIVVDPQNDFCKGGALEVPRADEIVPIINRLLPRFDIVIASQDWHEENHCSFVPQGGQWPPHCVAGTKGAEFHPQLYAHRFTVIVRKAIKKEAYSAFCDTGLEGMLCALDVDKVYICGLATDFCVKETAIDCAKFRCFRTFVLLGACRAVTEEGADKAISEMREYGVMSAPLL
jgi:nicotinamidase/pyrazinamidase